MAEVKASHILVGEKELADEIKGKIDQGESFEAMAEKYSKCPSKKKGGNLGWFKRGMMVREFERNSVSSVAVLLDAHDLFVSSDDPWSNLEYQIRAAASVCHYVAGLNCRVAFAAGGAERIFFPPAPAARMRATIPAMLAVLQPGRYRLAGSALELGNFLASDTAVYCFSLSTSRPLAEALDLLSQTGMTVRWFCADRDVFRRARADKGRAVARARSPVHSRWQMPVVQVHPSMSLSGAFSHGR